MTWKEFKKICGKKKKGWITGQMLCERHNVIITGHRTRRENFNYLFDMAVQALKKFAKGSDKKKKVNYERMFFGASKKKTKLDIFPKKNYDFKKMDKNLLGVKKKLF